MSLAEEPAVTACGTTELLLRSRRGLSGLDVRSQKNLLNSRIINDLRSYLVLMLGVRKNTPNSRRISHLYLDLVLHVQQDHFHHQDQKVRRRHPDLRVREVPGQRAHLPRDTSPRRCAHRALRTRALAQPLSSLPRRGFRRCGALLETPRRPVIRVLLPPRLLRLYPAGLLAFRFPTRSLTSTNPWVRPE